MNILNILKVYATKWNVKEKRSFTQEELNGISSARVVASQYGNSICLTLVRGGNSYIPCATDCPLTVGEEVNPSSLKLITLQREGDSDIYRVTV